MLTFLVVYQEPLELPVSGMFEYNTSIYGLVVVTSHVPTTAIVFSAVDFLQFFKEDLLGIRLSQEVVSDMHSAIYGPK